MIIGGKDEDEDVYDDSNDNTMIVMIIRSLVVNAQR